MREFGAMSRRARRRRERARRSGESVVLVVLVVNALIVCGVMLLVMGYGAR